MENGIAIEVKDLTKSYKLYEKPMDRLKDSLGLAGKKKFKEHLALNHVNLTVKKGETVAVVDNEPVICPENGVIGGILAEGAPVTRDRRCAEILKPEEAVYGKVVSEKALAVGGGVLEALLHFREVY